MKAMSTGEQGGPGTVVGVNVALSGTLKDANDIVVYGMVDGEVVSEKSVMVGETAQVKGPVRGAIVTVAGIVRGAIDAAERMELLETGKVYGSIATKDLVVRSGALLVGKVTMASNEEVVEEPTPETEETAESTEEAAEKNPPAGGEEVLTPDEE